MNGLHIFDLKLIEIICFAINMGLLCFGFNAGGVEQPRDEAAREVCLE